MSYADTLKDYPEYEGMSYEELFAPGFSDLPEEEQVKRLAFFTKREHERYVERWERMTDEERRKERMDHFRN